MILKPEDLTIDNLEKCFDVASHADKKYVGVLIKMEGFPKPEVVINESENFDSKFAYYKKAYDENLVLRSFSGIRIIGFTYGNELTDIEYDFFAPKLVNFGKALEAVKAGMGMRLTQWSADVVIRAQWPDENSKMTAPYLYVDSRFGKVPWKETMIELFAENWEIVN